MTTRTRFTIGSLAVFAIFAAGLAYRHYTAPAPQEAANESIGVTLAIEGVLPLHATTVKKGTTALEFLRNESHETGFALEEKEYAGLGSMVERIESFENGTNGKYWTYTVNGAFAAVGADAYELRPQDAIEWTFVVPENY